jgi:hypothetical protein
MALRPMNWRRVAELERIREATARLYGVMSLRDIAMDLGCALSSVQAAAKALGLPPRLPYLKPGEAPHRQSNNKIAAQFGRQVFRVTLTCPCCGAQRAFVPSKVAYRLSDMCQPCAAKNRQKRIA